LSSFFVLLKRRRTNISRKEIATNTKTVFYFRKRNSKHRRSVGIAYMLWFFFGSLGIHKFYLGDTKEAYSLGIRYFWVDRNIYRRISGFRWQ